MSSLREGRNTSKRQSDITKAQITDTSGDKITLRDHIDDGRDGVVYSGEYVHGAKLDVAVKFYVPRQMTDMLSSPSRMPILADNLAYRFEHELKVLKDVTHPNLQQYVSFGMLKYDKYYFFKRCPWLEQDTQIPFIVTRLVLGHRLDRALPRKSLSRRRLLEAVRGIARGLAYLHARAVLHGDVRAENVIIEDPSETPILLDFGLAKSFAVDLDSVTMPYYDPNPMPKAARAHLERLKRSGPCDKEALKRLLFPFVDLYHFGLTLEKILESAAGRVLSDADRKFLGYATTALKDWQVNASGNSRMDGAIADAESLTERLERLVVGPDYFRSALEEGEGAPARTIVRRSGTVRIRSSVTPFLTTPVLRRLQHINQLALVHYVYPSAGQSRFDHSLSALGRAQDVWKALARHPAFLFHMGVKDVDKLEVAALLHDINHFPFLHYFQEAGIPKISRAQVFEPLVQFSEKNLAGTGTAYGGSRAAGLGELLAARGLTLEDLKAIQTGSAIESLSLQDQVIHSIINSGIDVDKLAYLADDAAFSGLPYGAGIDTHGLMEGMSIEQVVLPGVKKGIWHIVFSEESLPSVESLCFARYWNFQRLYWHHTNRAMASMIIWTVRRLYVAGAEDPTDYLRETLGLGEAGALRYLSRAYLRHLREPAPIDELATNRDLIYRRVFEARVTEDEKELSEALSGFRDRESGHAKREDARQEILNAVERLASRKNIIRTVHPREVLLDIPLRSMDLGGRIFIRKDTGDVVPATAISPMLRELQRSFREISKIIRVFVSPELRDDIGSATWVQDQDFRDEVLKALKGKRQNSEVQ